MPTGIENSEKNECSTSKLVVEPCQIDFFYEKFKQVREQNICYKIIKLLANNILHYILFENRVILCLKIPEVSV